MLIHREPNNTNSIVYHPIILRYLVKTLHWYFPKATALHLYNTADRGEKLQQLHCYHTFSDSRDIHLTKNHYENYSPKMVPIAIIWGSGSWTTKNIGSLSVCGDLYMTFLISKYTRNIHFNILSKTRFVMPFNHCTIAPRKNIFDEGALCICQFRC